MVMHAWTILSAVSCTFLREASERGRLSYTRNTHDLLRDILQTQTILSLGVHSKTDHFVHLIRQDPEGCGQGRVRGGTSNGLDELPVREIFLLKPKRFKVPLQPGLWREKHQILNGRPSLIDGHAPRGQSAPKSEIATR